MKEERESELLLLWLARAVLARPISDSAMEFMIGHELDVKPPDETYRQLAERLAAVRVHTKVKRQPCETPG